MKAKEARVVDQTYRKLLESESKEFNEVDDYLDILKELDSDQLCREAAVMLVEHKTGHIIPDFNVPNSSLLTPMVVDSVSYILIDYDTMGILMSIKHRYILEMYLALQQAAKLAMIKKKK